MAITLVPATLSIAHGGSTQQFTTDPADFTKWSISGDINAVGADDPTGSSITQGGLFTSGIAGTVYVQAVRYDGERSQTKVTVTP